MPRSIPNAASAMLWTLPGHASQSGANRQEESLPPRRLNCVSAPHMAGARGGPCPACVLGESARRSRCVVAATLPDTVASMQQCPYRGSSYLSLGSLVALSSFACLASFVSWVSTKLELPGFLDIQATVK